MLAGMEWFKLGLEAVKVVYDAKRQYEIAEANRERDEYKMKADNLEFQLVNLKDGRNKSGNGKKNENHRRNFQSFGYNPKQDSGNHHNSSGKKSDTYSNFSSQNHKDGWKPSTDRNGYGQDSSFVKHRSNTIHKSFGLANETERKSKPNAANIGMNRRGSFQNTGRGRGRSNVKF